MCPRQRLRNWAARRDEIPPLVGGHGALTEASIKIGKSYRSGGTKREYLAARCSTNVLKAYGKFIFEDKTIISGTIFKPCRSMD